jgi:hypothetical protein
VNIATIVNIATLVNIATIWNIATVSLDAVTIQRFFVFINETV